MDFVFCHPVVFIVYVEQYVKPSVTSSVSLFSGIDMNLAINGYFIYENDLCLSYEVSNPKYYLLKKQQY